MLKRLLKQDWEVVAVLLAATAALVLHFLHIAEEGTLLAIAVVLLAFLLIRDMKRESQAGHFSSIEDLIATNLEDIKSSLTPPGIELIGPSELHETTLRFAKKGRGEVVCFNICLRMYKSQQPFDIMVRPFIENPEVTSIQFVLDSKERERWNKDVMPKVVACAGSKKVKEPYWYDLEENVSFILVETGSFGKAEALVSFWGEPFMSKASGINVPRYILYVRENSELIKSLKERERICRSA